MCALAACARALATALDVAASQIGGGALLTLVVLALACALALLAFAGRALYVHAYEQGHAAGSRRPLADSVTSVYASVAGATASVAGATASVAGVDAGEAQRTALVVRDLEQSHRVHGRLARGVRSLFAVFDAVLDTELPKGTAARKRADAIIARDSGAFVRLYARSEALLSALNAGK